ncbi:AraC family transcriptional regulator [Carnobacterium gallinarum]
MSNSVGYKDSLTFSKAFKKFYQISPTEFRMINGTEKYQWLIG